MAGRTATNAAALPSSAEAAASVLRQLRLTRGETLLLIGGGSVGIIATQLAVAQGVNGRNWARSRRSRVTKVEAGR